MRTEIAEAIVPEKDGDEVSGFRWLGVEGRFDCEAAALDAKRVSVDHGGFYVFVSEEFLHSSNVVAVLQEMGGEAVTEGVRGDAFLYFCSFCGGSNGSLQGGFVDVMTAGDACFSFGVECWRRKDELPDPFFVGGGVFFVEGEGHLNGTKASGEVFFVDGFCLGEMFAHGDDDTVGKHGDAVVAAFSIVDEDAVVFKVYVFDSEAQTFHEAESAAVHDLCHKFVWACHVGDDGAHFFYGEYVGDSFSFFGSDEIEGGLVEFDVEGVAVEEEYGADSLILGGGGGFTVDDEVGDELVDLSDTHFTRVAFVVKEDVCPNPLDVGFFSTV